MKTSIVRWTLGGVLLASTGSLSAQDASLDKVMGTVESLSSLVENFDKVANSPDAYSRGSAKAAIARATVGAATGAAIGAMTHKGDKAVIAGAIIGAVAGLVYDRVKVSKEHQSQAAELPPCAVPTQDPAYAR